MFTELERSRLEKRTGQELPDKERRYNDMVVRNKIKSWLKESEDVLFALEHLPTRKLKKDITDGDIYSLFYVGLEFLRILEFVPIESLSGYAVVSRPVKSSGEKRDSWVRKATEEDFERNYRLELIVNELNKMVSTSDEYKRYKFDKMRSLTNGRFFSDYEEEKRYYKDAISSADKAIDKDPSNAEAWYNKGAALWCLDKYDEALECLDKAIGLPSTYWTFLSAINAKKTILKSLGRHAEADVEDFVYFLRMVEADPSNADNREEFGDYFYSKERYKEAIECYDEAIKLEPLNDSFWCSKGDALHKMGRFEKALKCFEKAIELDSSYSRPFEGKGNALKALGRVDEAEVFLTKAKELESKLLEDFNSKNPTTEAVPKDRETE